MKEKIDISNVPRHRVCVDPDTFEPCIEVNGEWLTVEKYVELYPNGNDKNDKTSD